MLGKKGIEEAFNKTNFSDAYWIHRTRRNFPDYTPNRDGEDSFPMMAKRGLAIIDRVVVNEMGGNIDATKNNWHIPIHDKRN